MQCEVCCMLAFCRKRQFSGVYVGNECDKQDESHAISIYRKLHGSKVSMKNRSPRKKKAASVRPRAGQGQTNTRLGLKARVGSEGEVCPRQPTITHLCTPDKRRYSSTYPGDCAELPIFRDFVFTVRGFVSVPINL